MDNKFREQLQSIYSTKDIKPPIQEDKIKHLFQNQSNWCSTTGNNAVALTYKNYEFNAESIEKINIINEAYPGFKEKIYKMSRGEIYVFGGFYGSGDKGSDFWYDNVLFLPNVCGVNINIQIIHEGNHKLRNNKMEEKLLDLAYIFGTQHNIAIGIKKYVRKRTDIIKTRTGEWVEFSNYDYHFIGNKQIANTMDKHFLEIGDEINIAPNRLMKYGVAPFHPIGPK